MGFEYQSQVRPSTGYPDPKESYQIGFRLDEEAERCWPAEDDCAGFREGVEKFKSEVRELSLKVMELLAEGVGLVSCGGGWWPLTFLRLLRDPCGNGFRAQV